MKNSVQSSVVTALWVTNDAGMMPVRNKEEEEEEEGEGGRGRGERRRGGGEGGRENIHVLLFNSHRILYPMQ